MSNIASYGIMPFIGGANNVQVMRFYCDGSANSILICVGDVVQADSGGGVKVSAASVKLGNVGAVVGIYDVNGIPVGHPSSAVSTKYLPASIKGYVDVALALPGSFFIGQSAATSYAAIDIFASVPLVATAGSTVTAHSNHNLGAVTTGQSDFLLLQVSDEPSNAVGSANCNMLIQFNASIFGQGTGVGL